MSCQQPVRASRSALTVAPPGNTYPPWPAICAQRVPGRVADQPRAVDCTTPFTVRAWEPVAPRLRFSTTVSTAAPSVARTDPARQTIASARQNQDFLAYSVLDSPRTNWPTAAYSPSVAPPTQFTSGRGRPHAPPSASASGFLDTVVPGSRYGSTVGQKASVYWPLPYVAPPPLEHARAGVPAAEVLPVARLVEAHPPGGHADRGRPAGPAVDGPVHAGEEAVPGRLRDRRDGAVVQYGPQPGQCREAEVGVREHRAVVVPLRPALHQPAPTLPLRAARGGPQQGYGGEDVVAPAVVTALEPVGVGPRTAPAGGAAGHRVHHQAVVEERGEGLLHRVEDQLPAGVGDRPGRTVEQDEEPGQAAQQHRTVGAGVGEVGVLDEGPVGVEAVPAGDDGEDGGEGVAGERDLGGIPAEDAAQDQ